MGLVHRAKLCEKEKDYASAADSYAQALKALEGHEREESVLVERISKSRGIAMCKLMDQRSKGSLKPQVSSASQDFDSLSGMASVGPIGKQLVATVKTPNSKRLFFKAASGSANQVSLDSPSKFVIKKNNFMLHPRSVASQRRGLSPRSSVTSTNEFADQDLREGAVLPPAVFNDGPFGLQYKRPSSSRPSRLLRQPTPPKEKTLFKIRGSRGRFANDSQEESRDPGDDELEAALIREPVK